MTASGDTSLKAVRVFFTGVGGQGTLLATRLVGEAAEVVQKLLERLERMRLA